MHLDGCSHGSSDVAILHYMGDTHMHLDGHSHGPSGVAILHYTGDTHMHLDACSHGPSGATILHYIGDTHLAQYDHLHGLRMVLANTGLFLCGRSMI
jgi:hypothetical protein